MKNSFNIKVSLVSLMLLCGNAMANLTFYNDTNSSISFSSNNSLINRLIQGEIKPGKKRLVVSSWQLVKTITKGEAFTLAAVSGVKHEEVAVVSLGTSGKIASISTGDFLFTINDYSSAAVEGDVIPENASIHVRLPQS